MASAFVRVKFTGTTAVRIGVYGMVSPGTEFSVSRRDFPGLQEGHANEITVLSEDDVRVPTTGGDSPAPAPVSAPEPEKGREPAPAAEAPKGKKIAEAKAAKKAAEEG